MNYLFKSIKNFLKKSKVIAAIFTKYSWTLHRFKDWFGTKVWKKTSEVKTAIGFKLVSGFHPAYSQMRNGTFEIIETKHIETMLSMSDIFVDIGANLGYYTCFAAMHGKTVLAFEPQHQNLDCLTKNIVINQYQSLVEIYGVGLSEKVNILELYGASGPSASLIKGWAGYSDRHHKLIPLNTLDNILSSRYLDKQLLIKIDVEGAEYQVLLGALTTLKRKLKPMWIIEICLQEFHPEGHNPDYEKIFELFFDNGYVAYSATEHPMLVQMEEIKLWCKNGLSSAETFNYIFVPEDSKLIFK